MAPPFSVNLSLSAFIKQSDFTSDIMPFYADLISTSYMWVWLRWPLYLIFASYPHAILGRALGVCSLIKNARVMQVYGTWPAKRWRLLRVTGRIR